MSNPTNPRDAELGADAIGRLQAASSGGGTVKYADTVTELRNIDGGSVGWVAVLFGYNIRGDAGGGIFYWDSASAADNKGTTINKSFANSAGWRRITEGGISVRVFGARGNGSSNDWNAIQAAINYVAGLDPEGGVVNLPPGTYRITQSLDMKKSVSLNGSGGRSSVIKAELNPTFTAAIKFADKTSFGNSVLRDLNIEGVNGAGKIGIENVVSYVETDEVYGITIENCLIRGFEVGMHFRQARTLTIVGNWIQDVSRGIELIGRNLLCHITRNKIVKGLEVGKSQAHS